MEKSYIINKTGRAVAVISSLVFSIGTIVYEILQGNPANVIHVNALSYSYYLLIFCLLALGIDNVALNSIAAFGNKPPA